VAGGETVLSGVAIGGAFVLDVLVGEPPRRFHPVAWFGRLVAQADGGWARPRLAGAVAAVTLPALAALTVGSVVVAAGSVHPLAAAVVGALLLFVSTSLRRLLDRVREVTSVAGEDIAAARQGLRALAGRDATALSAGQLRSAAVESLAENLADGLVAPLSGYALFAVTATALGTSPTVTVAAGAAGAAWVKAVNTLDSMLGYHEKAVGWAPARLDDAVMWLPARLSAGLLAVVGRAPRSLLRARRWNDDVASPNSGWPMGTMAAILGVRLEKPGHYTLNANARLPDADATAVAVRTVGLAGVLAYALAGVVTWT
jgi:adenosylcobinamide-phosphate synthase